MTPQDFCHWLDGYLAGAESPDPEVIKAKARQITPNVQVVPAQPWQPVGPGTWPQTPPYPRIGDFWCGTGQTTDFGQ